MISPALTSIRLPKYELGRAAAELLIAETDDPDHSHRPILFEPELIERQSTTARARLNQYSPQRRLASCGPMQWRFSTATATPRRTLALSAAGSGRGAAGQLEQLIFEMDANGIGQALVVCASINENPDNLDYVADACRRYPEPSAMVADLDCVWSETYHAPGSAARLADAV